MPVLSIALVTNTALPGGSKVCFLRGMKGDKPAYFIIMRSDGTGPGDWAAVLSKFSLDGQAKVCYPENRKRE